MYSGFSLHGAAERTQRLVQFQNPSAARGIGMFFTSDDILDEQGLRHLGRLFERSDIGDGQGSLVEMSRFESSFLVGLIKKAKPKKILEVGVAAGGTSSIILSALADMQSDAALISVDLNVQHYCASDRKTGYLVQELIPQMNGQWSLFTGAPLPAFIEEIGNGIDFLILDTVHFLPGELLDFITAFPYLTKHATVVLHDTHAHLRTTRPMFATKILLDSIVGHKIICKDANSVHILPNISGVITNSDTKKYIANTFSALSMPWYYLPSDQELDEYGTIVQKHYEPALYEYYELAVKAARKRHALFSKAE